MGIKTSSDYYGADEATKFSATTLDAFAQAFLKGELTPYVKPEPPPAEDSGGGDDDDAPPYDDDADGEEELKDEA